MATRKLKAGDLYEGPKAIDTIDGVTAHWALTKDGPVRLVQIDLAPDNPDDGSEEYRIAGDDDPVQETPQSVVELEVEEVHGQASSEV
jgi:hypothetical protein